MVPDEMLNNSDDQHKLQFFEKRSVSGNGIWSLKQKDQQAETVLPSIDPIASLSEVIGAETSKKKHPRTEMGQSSLNYDMFVDLIYKMLAYKPEERIRPEEAMQHPFIVAGEYSQTSSSFSGSQPFASRGGGYSSHHRS